MFARPTAEPGPDAFDLHSPAALGTGGRGGRLRSQADAGLEKQRVLPRAFEPHRQQGGTPRRQLQRYAARQELKCPEREGSQQDDGGGPQADARAGCGRRTARGAERDAEDRLALAGVRRRGRASPPDSPVPPVPWAPRHADRRSQNGPERMIRAAGCGRLRGCPGRDRVPPATRRPPAGNEEGGAA